MAIDDEQILAGNPPEDEEEEEEEDEDDEDEELVDPRDSMRTECENSASCAAYKAELDACTERVSSKSNTEETCTQELFDFLHCVDHCAAPNTFKHYK